MTDLTDELLAASRALLPHLKTSSDPLPHRTIAEIQSELASSASEDLRRRADAIEEKEAAIWRLRKAVAALDGVQS
jgi:hypothetical protein